VSVTPVSAICCREQRSNLLYVDISFKNIVKQTNSSSSAFRREWPAKLQALYHVRDEVFNQSGLHLPPSLDGVVLAASSLAGGLKGHPFAVQFASALVVNHPIFGPSELPLLLVAAQQGDMEFLQRAIVELRALDMNVSVSVFNYLAMIPNVRIFRVDEVPDYPTCPGANTVAPHKNQKAVLGIKIGKCHRRKPFLAN
jgi:hypothetical protein